MKNKKKILILGGGLYQIKGIRDALNQNLEVYTVDNRKRNIGHKVSNRYINEDLKNKENILKIYLKLNIDFYLTFASDIGLQTCAFMEQNLIKKNLNFIFSNKKELREIQEKLELPMPNYLISNQFFDKNNDIFKSKYVLKPLDSSGSKGVKIFEKYNYPSNKDLDSALQYSDLNEVIFENYIFGEEYGGDCYILDGEIVDINITKKVLSGSEVIGHIINPNVDSVIVRDLKKQLSTVSSYKNYFNGPINYDFKILNDRVIFIEFSFRTGGNGITHLIESTKHLSYEKLLINQITKKDDIDLSRVRIGNKKFGSLNIKTNSIDKFLELNAENIITKEWNYSNNYNNDVSTLTIFEISNENDFFNMKKKLEKIL
jgi:hypothetical protein